MKLLAKVVSVIGVIALFVGASMMDSDNVVLPIFLCLSGMVAIGAGAYVGGLFWDWEEIE